MLIAYHRAYQSHRKGFLAIGVGNVMSFGLSLACLQLHSWSHFTKPQEGLGVKVVGLLDPVCSMRKILNSVDEGDLEENVFFPVLLTI